MSDLDDDAKDLFAAGRGADLPRPADRVRVRAKLTVALAAGGATAFGTAKGSAAAVASAGGSSTAGTTAATAGASAAGAAAGAGGAAGGITASTGAAAATGALMTKVVSVVAVVAAVAAGGNAVVTGSRPPEPTSPPSSSIAWPTSPAPSGTSPMVAQPVLSVSLAISSAPIALPTTPAPPVVEPLEESAVARAASITRPLVVGHGARPTEPGERMVPAGPLTIAPSAALAPPSPTLPLPSSPLGVLADPPSGGGHASAPPVDTPASRSDHDAKSGAEPVAAPGVSGVSEELVMLREAHGAIERGQGEAALNILAAHAARFPRAVLAEEREASRVLALCAAGRVESARSEGRAFLAAHPRSPFAQRIRVGCAAP